MTQKANANQQSNVNFFRGKRHVAGRAAVAVPRAAPRLRHPGHFLADAILVPGNGDVNLNLETVSSRLSREVPREGNPQAVRFPLAGAAFISEQADLGERGFVAAFDDEDEE